MIPFYASFKYNHDGYDEFNDGLWPHIHHNRPWTKIMLYYSSLDTCWAYLHDNSSKFQASGLVQVDISNFAVDFNVCLTM